MLNYEYKTTPFDHQRSDLEAHWSLPAWAWFWEQGTGKTKEVIDNSAALYEGGEIGGIFNLAPNGIHRNFITKQLAAHLPDRIAERARSVFFRSDRAETKWHQRVIKELIDYKDGLVTLSMSYDALTTKPGAAAARAFLESRRCLYAADETGRFKTPTSLRARYVLKSAPYAPYRRITCGTPVDNCPWDIWAQMKFLDADFWVPHGLDDYRAMKAVFGVWGKGYVRIPGQFNDDGSPKLRPFPRLERDAQDRPIYRNLDRLQRIVASRSSRVLKEDVLDLPPKLYGRIEFEMTKAQTDAYDALRRNGFVALGDSIATAPIAITLLLRLQQISCGYLPTIEQVYYDEDGNIDHVETKMVRFEQNPRLEILRELTEDMTQKCIIWARFREDINQIMDMLKAQGKTAVRYDGTIDDDEAAEAERQLQEGDAQFFVANQAKGSEGLTLTAAKTVIYYSNTFKLKDRLQSEDRAHRIGQTDSVDYIDIVGENTVDEPVLDALLAKFNVAAQVTGDMVRAWLQ